MSEHDTEVVEIDKSEGAEEQATMEVVTSPPEDVERAVSGVQDDGEDSDDSA